MIPAFASIGVVVIGVAAILTIAGVRMSRPGNGHHTAGAYIPTGNPFRIGNTVLICEDPARPEMNWYGTVLSTTRGFLTVRDTSSPFHTIDLEKEYVFPASSNLGW
jgi:hypothetical protein